jgi:hypothetical protein
MSKYLNYLSLPSPFKSVFRIHVFLVQIRIRICGSEIQNYESGSGWDPTVLFLPWFTFKNKDLLSFHGDFSNLVTSKK